MIYTMHKELAAPTVINLAISCHFTSATKLNLVLAKGNMLCVYQVYTTGTSNQEYPTARLELIHEFKLQGVIISMSAVRTTTGVGLQDLDSLLLTFKDAKMSLIEYSAQNQSIVTVSMHYFEKEELRKDVSNKGRPSAQVDPESRCAIMKFYEYHFAVLPFKSENSLDDAPGSKNIPFLPSFVIKETEIDKSIRNVIDFKFLYGFLEPTLAILYEPEQTYAGRLAYKKDTVSLIVVSLDIHQKTYPVLFKVDGLPYNCTHMAPVPSPLGGILIFSHNALIHLDQTHTPGCAAIVNPFFDLESHFKPIPTDDGTPVLPVKNKPTSVYLRYGKTSDCKALGISLDGSRSVFLSPDIVLLVLRTGDLYRVDLVGDDGAGRSWKRKRGGVRNITIKNLGLNMALPSILIELANLAQFTKPRILGTIIEMKGLKYYSNFFFAASNASDATLVQFMEPIEATEEKTETVEDMDVDLGDELDAELYGGSYVQKSTSKSGLTDAPILFRVCDMLLSTGPIRNMAVGQPAPYSDQEYSGEPAGCHLEIVGCGGYDTYGSLVVLHRSIRPHILSSFSLGKISDIWSVPAPKTDNPEQEFNRYLLLSKPNGTRILRTGDEIEELETSGFHTQGPTVSVGTCLNGSVVVQVYQNGLLCLTQDGKKISDLSIGDENNWIVAATITDPYCAILLNTGKVNVLEYKERLVVLKTMEFSTPITCLNVFKDDLPIQQFPSINEMPVKMTNLPKKKDKKPGNSETIDKKEKPKEDMDLYGDDMDLYGDDEDDAAFALEDVLEVGVKPMDIDENKKRKTGDQYWLSTVDEAGTFLIYSLSDFEEKFKFNDLRCGHRFVYDQYSSDMQPETGKYLSPIEEILICSLGADVHRANTFLMTRNDKFDVYIYKVIPTLEIADNCPRSRLGIQLVRMENEHIGRDLQQYMDGDGDKMQPIGDTIQRQKFSKKTRLVPFEKIGVSSQQVYAGVVVTGPRPCWIMMALAGGRECANFIVQEGSEQYVLPPALLNSSNTIRIHPMIVDGQLDAFTPLHNVNIPFGFAYINEKKLFRLAQLPIQFTFDHQLPICKVPLGRSAQKLSYHATTQTYVMASSRRAVFQIDQARYMAAVAAGVIEKGDELPESERKVSGIQDVIQDREQGMYLPEVNAFQLELVSPVTWETVDRIALDETEQIIALQTVELASKENTSGRKTFVAVGTGYMRSEELSCRGRLLVYDVIDVVPEPGRPQTNHKLKLFFSSEEKNPVTALCAVNGYLLATIGTKVLMYAMEDGDLNGIAFLDVPIFIVGLSSVKNFILIADMFKSVWFVVFQEDPPKLIMLGKDLYPVRVVGTEIIISDTTLAMLVSDEESNLHVMTYEPYSIQSNGGQKLLRRGEMNLGFEMQTFVPLRMRPKLKDVQLMESKNIGAIAGSLNGGLSMIVPVPEKIFRRLYGLYSRMVTHLEHFAGLNPRGFRQIVLPLKSIHSTAIVPGPPGPRGILDGDLLYRFCILSTVHQYELAKAVGSRNDRALDDLLELIKSLEYF